MIRGHDGDSAPDRAIVPLPDRSLAAEAPHQSGLQPEVVL